MRPPKYLLALGLATALTACVVPAQEYYTQRHYTNPNYTIVEVEGNMEIRDYQSLLAAEVTETGTREAAMRNGYEALNDYFQGNNSTGEGIAMTKPILQFPVFNNIHGYTNIRTVDNHKWVIRFYLPVEYARASVPMPKNPNIRILETNPTSVAAVSFAGPWTDANIQSNEDLLKDYVVNNGLHALDVPAYAFYDSPTTDPWSRHNEILMKLAD